MSFLKKAHKSLRNKYPQVQENRCWGTRYNDYATKSDSLEER